MDFTAINGGVSPDNDSYSTTIDVLLLEQEAKEKDGDENFLNEKSAVCEEEFNFIDDVHDEGTQGMKFISISCTMITM